MTSSQSVLAMLKELRQSQKDDPFDGLSRAPNPGHDSFDQRLGIVPEDSPELKLVEPSIHTPPSRRHPVLKKDQFASNKPSFGRRIFRGASRFLIVALIGAGVTLTWQSYGREAKEMVRAQVPSLAWLLPVSSTKSASEGQVTPVAVITSPELTQQLKPMAIDLALVRRSIEELAAQQKQMAERLATLQAVEQDIRQKISSPPSSRVVTAPPRKPATRVAAPQPTTQASVSSPPPPDQTECRNQYC